MEAELATKIYHRDQRIEMKIIKELVFETRVAENGRLTVKKSYPYELIIEQLNGLPDIKGLVAIWVDGKKIEIK